MATARRKIVTIGGFCFEWNSFPNLDGIFPKEQFDNLFNRIDNHFGVYLFCKSGSIPYVGLCGKNVHQKQYMPVRIRQYFKPSLDTGNSFAKHWMKKNDQTYKDFKSYIASCQLKTLSIDLSCLNLDAKKRLIPVIKDMENFLICEYKPTYTDSRYPTYKLTDAEENNLISSNIPRPAHDSQTDRAREESNSQ